MKNEQTPRSGDLVRVKRWSGTWIVDQRDRNAIGRKWRVFEPGPLRRSITVPESQIELHRQVFFEPGAKIVYEQEPAEIINDMGNAVSIRYQRQHTFWDGRKTLPQVHPDQTVPKHVLVEENFAMLRKGNANV